MLCLPCLQFLLPYDNYYLMTCPEVVTISDNQCNWKVKWITNNSDLEGGYDWFISARLDRASCPRLTDTATARGHVYLSAQRASECSLELCSDERDEDPKSSSCRKGSSSETNESPLLYVKTSKGWPVSCAEMIGSQCLGFCAAELWSSLAYESAE